MRHQVQIQSDKGSTRQEGMRMSRRPALKVRLCLTSSLICGMICFNMNMLQRCTLMGNV